MKSHAASSSKTGQAGHSPPRAAELICIFRNGRLDYINPGGAQLLGAVNSARLLGRPVGEVVQGHPMTPVDRGAPPLLGKSGHLVFRGLNGEAVTTTAKAEILESTNGAMLVHALSRHITVGEDIPCGVLVWDNGRLVFANDEALRLLGAQSPEQILGRSIAALAEPDSAAWLAAAGHEDAGRPAPFIFRGVHGRGVGVQVVFRRLGSESPATLVIETFPPGTQPFEAAAAGPGAVPDEQPAGGQMATALLQARDRLAGRLQERCSHLQHLAGGSETFVAATEGIIGIDQTGQITFVNTGAAEMSGWAVDELIGRNPDTLFGPHAFADGSHGREGSGQGTERMLWRRDGSGIPVESATASVEEDGQSVGSIIVFSDISERKSTEEKLRLAAVVFETTAEAIMVLDASFRITTVNPAFAAITGYQAQEVIGRRPSFLALAQGDGDPLEAIWDSIRRQGRWDCEQWNRRKNGEEYAERLSITAIADDGGQISQYVVVFSDITQRKLDEERIRYQASYDTLTGLPNRSLFIDRLNQALNMAERTGQRVGLMFLDLDGFKLVNDTLGHDVGDELLKEAAKRLMFCVRHGDTVARLGGDEFTIIMPNLGEVRNAPAVAQRIIDTLEQPFTLRNNEAFVSASIGITAFPDDAATAKGLLRNADAAMYRAKEQGKANFQFFTAELNAEVSQRMIIKSGLSKALERQEFSVFYQPKCELATGRLTGVEALLRWRSAEQGWIPPTTFIPVMEDTGLISQVGDWVIETACIQHKAWQEAGYGNIRVAVNLSVRQLRQGDLPKTIERMLVRHGVEPAGIELEITESMIMRDTEHAVAVLRSLSDMGIHLAMDDFGTGYSSLSYLKRFPLHTIKIDRSFIHDIATDPDDLEIIRTIISMGHSLRRRVVAEGVETEDQRALLRKLRCDEMQGFLLSPPVPAAEIERMLASMRFGHSV
jgi:diguanylate cyclase (GGDEF)-like protein/PAS domain S-box-containing protein